MGPHGTLTKFQGGIDSINKSHRLFVVFPESGGDIIKRREFRDIKVVLIKIMLKL